MDYLAILLRLVHILSGVFWVGGALISTFSLAPAAAATGETGQKFMNYLFTQGRISVMFTVASILTVLSGAWLYLLDFGGMTSAWISSGAGLGFGLGAIFALIGMGIGSIVGRSAATVSKITSATQGNPTQLQLSEMETAQKQMNMASLISTIALILALVCMAIARELGGMN
jgi:uncharacterized membrane protein